MKPAKIRSSKLRGENNEWVSTGQQFHSKSRVNQNVSGFQQLVDCVYVLVVRILNASDAFFVAELLDVHVVEIRVELKAERTESQFTLPSRCPD